MKPGEEQVLKAIQLRDIAHWTYGGWFLEPDAVACAKHADGRGMVAHYVIRDHVTL